MPKREAITVPDIMGQQFLIAQPQINSRQGTVIAINVRLVTAVGRSATDLVLPRDARQDIVPEQLLTAQAVRQQHRVTIPAINAILVAAVGH